MQPMQLYTLENTVEKCNDTGGVSTSSRGGTHKVRTNATNATTHTLENTQWRNDTGGASRVAVQEREGDTHWGKVEHIYAYMQPMQLYTVNKSQMQ